MGEFVGIDPGGATKLIRTMEEAKKTLAALRPELENAIATAGPDWTGRNGTAAMHRAWAFLDDSQRDLRWRISVITRLDRSQVHVDGGLLTARFPYAGEAEAVQAGRRAGLALAAAFDEYKRDFSLEGWRKVEAAMAAVKDGAADPAYAAALLAALGPGAFRTLFTQWMNVHHSGPARGLPPEPLDRARPFLGPLATAFAAAESDGRLDGRWRAEVLQKAGPATLATLAVLAKQSAAFLNDAALRLLSLPGAGANMTTPHADWNTHWLIKAYDNDPQAFQRLLADRPEAVRLVLNPLLVKGTETPGFERLLASAFDKALRKETGDPAVRARAWFNLINGFGRPETDEYHPLYLSLTDSPLNVVFARHVTPYLEELARGQARQASPELAAALAATPPWHALDPGVPPQFFGAVMQDPKAARILYQEFQTYVGGLDLGRYHPFSSDAAERARYTRLSAQAGGLANLLLGGAAYAEFNDDEFAEMVANVAILPVDYTFNRVSYPGPLAATMSGYQADKLKTDLKELVQDFLDGKTPDTARVVADRLVDMQVDQVITSLRKHGGEPLTPEDVDQLRQALKGRMHEALVKALENRGG